MGVVPNEPSMEDILSSIKRIIADGSDRATSVRTARRRARDEDDVVADEAENAPAQEAAILELTDMVQEPAPPEPEALPEPVAEQVAPAKDNSAAPVSQEERILSDISAQAARQSLSQLSSLLVRPAEGEANTLEGLVREMLRPMLKDWLEAKLPEMVESLVKKEIDRIVGRLG